jgi:hypothetical protein
MDGMANTLDSEELKEQPPDSSDNLILQLVRNTLASISHF